MNTPVINIINAKGKNIVTTLSGQEFDRYDKTKYNTRQVLDELEARWGNAYIYRINGKATAATDKASMAPPPPVSPIAQVEDCYDPNLVDITTGEVLQDNNEIIINTNPLIEMNANTEATAVAQEVITNSNPVQMNTETAAAPAAPIVEAQAQPTVEATQPIAEPVHVAEPIGDTKASTPIADMTKANKPLTHRLRTGGAKGAEIGVKIATDPVITGLILTADAIYKVAEGIAWTQAGAIHLLKTHPEMTVRNLKEAAMDRNQNRLDTLYAIPTGAIAAVKMVRWLKQAETAGMNIQPQPAV